MRSILLLLFLIIVPLTALWAGSTSYYHPSTGTPLQWETDADGKATIHYTVDAGGLGRLTHDQTLQLLQAAMAIWEAAANVEFIYDGTTAEAIDENNYRDYLVVDESICTDDSTAESVENSLQFDRISVIAFDNTEGSTILDDADGLGGTGTSESGLTNTTCISGSNADPEFITSAQIIFNGAFIDGVAGPADLTVNEMTATMVHELGHFIGLDHTSANQVLVDALRAGELDEDDYAIYMPTMAVLYTTEHRATLNPDDIAAAQALYPFADSPTSLVSGNITDSENADFRGAQLELRTIDDPLCEVYSFVSGKQCTPLYVNGGDILSSLSGTRCGDTSTNTGQFSLRAIPSGNYTLSAQEVIDDYKGGVIHPFSTEFPIDELVSEAEFYNDADLATEDFDSRTLITVTDDEDLDGLDITLSSSTADGDGEENLISLDFFSTTNGFTNSLTVTDSRCQPNTIDYAALIGVEELVGSDDGEDDGSDDTSSSAGGCSLVMK